MPGGRSPQQVGRRRVEGGRPQQRAEPGPRPLVLPTDLELGEGQRPGRERDQDQRGERNRPDEQAEQHTQAAAQCDQGRAGGGLREVGSTDAAGHAGEPDKVGDHQDAPEGDQRQQ